MRRFTKWSVLFFLLLGPPCLAQQQSVTANLTAQNPTNNTCPTSGACLVLNLAASTGSAVIQLSGTFSGTVQFEGSSGGTWFAVLGIPQAGGSGVTSATSTGAWRITGSGLASVRARVSTYASGTIVTLITAGPGASSSTQSAGGSVSEVDTSAPITGGPITSSGTIGLTVGTPCSSGTFSQGTDSLLNSQCAPVPASGGGTPPYVGPTAINGCGVEWTGLLTFTVGQCTYIINGITYSSAITNLTLAAADVTNPRIDDIIVDNTGVASVLTGTPAGSPAAPAVDPSTQLLLTFVTVAANATTPTGITSTTIYDENTEWTTAKGGTNSARVTLNSTNNPFRGTVDIEFGVGGTTTTTTYAQATKPAAGTENLATWNSLIFYIRNKAAWPTNRSLIIQPYNGSTAVGPGIVLNNNNFGFNATTNFTGYQQIIIPTSYFQTGSAAITTFRFTVSGSGAALTGFYLDAVSLQAGTAPTPPLPTTLMNYRGVYSAAVNYLPNDVVTVNGCYYVALAANLNVPVTTIATWAGTGSCATAKTGQVLTAVNGAPSVYATPGIADGNGGAAVTATPYTLKCDSSTAVLDGAHLIRFQSGAAAITVPLSTATGCTGNNMAFTLVDDGAGTLTVSRTSADTFSIFDGVTNTDGATSFTLTNGGFVTVSQGAAGIWEVRKTLNTAPSGATTCNPGSYAAQTDGATVTWAIGSNICSNGSLLFTTHGGSRTLNLTGMVNGGDYILKLTQDGTGGEGLTLGTGCTWKVSGGGAGAVTLTNGVSAIDVLTWSYDGTNCLANLNKNFN